MEDISLHVLDIMENALRAGAKTIRVWIAHDEGKDEMRVTIADDGRGMSKKEVRDALDPFYTTKDGKRIGLGLSLLVQDDLGHLEQPFDCGIVVRVDADQRGVGLGRTGEIVGLGQRRRDEQDALAVEVELVHVRPQLGKQTGPQLNLAAVEAQRQRTIRALQWRLHGAQ